MWELARGHNQFRMEVVGQNRDPKTFDSTLIGPGLSELNDLLSKRQKSLAPGTLDRLVAEAKNLIALDSSDKMVKKIHEGVQRFALRHIVMDSLKVIFKNAVSGSHETALYFKNDLNLPVQRHRFNFYQVPGGRRVNQKYAVPLPHASHRLGQSDMVTGFYYFAVTGETREIARYLGDISVLNRSLPKQHIVYDAMFITPMVLNQELDTFSEQGWPVLRTPITPSTLKTYADEVVNALW